jgi:GTP-binding protein
MKITTVELVASAGNPAQYPKGSVPEIACAGRSNVGKSSAINTLLGRRRLVPTSRTPGRTRRLDFYLVNHELVFVDLPGYGYAKVPLEIKRRWAPLTESYFRDRRELAGVIAFVDARAPLTALDIALLSYLESLSIPFVVGATKADKLRSGELRTLAKRIGGKLGEGVPVVCFSSMDGTGKKELWKEIKRLIEAMGRGRRDPAFPLSRRSPVNGSEVL